MVFGLKLVFSNYRYVILCGIIFVGLLIPLLIISEFIFLSPYLIGYIAEGRELSFSLVIIVSALAAIVLPMNVFRIKILKSSKGKIGGSVFGSIAGSIAGACSCGPIGFAVISTFGSIGGVATAFLTNYEIPIRIGAIALLALTYYTTERSLEIECKLSR